MGASKRKADLDGLAAAASGQGGYFTTRQARSAGFSAPLLAYHLKAGNFERVGHGLYRLPLLPYALHDDLVRLSLWSRDRQGRPQAVVSHESALALHELTDGIPREVHLTVPIGFRKPAPRGCVLHRAELSVAETAAREGFRVTRVERTLAELAALPTFPEGQFDRALRLAVKRDLVSSTRAKSLAALRARAVRGAGAQGGPPSGTGAGDSGEVRPHLHLGARRAPAGGVVMEAKSKLRVVVPLSPGFEELEFVAVVDILRRAGVDVVTAGLPAGRGVVEGSHGIAIAPDVGFEEVDLDAVTALVLPGGPGTRRMGEDARLLALVRRLAGEGRPLAAICAAPLVLARAGVLEGREATSHPSVRGELGGAKVIEDQRVVSSANVVTSQGAGTAVEFALALVAAWVSPAKADEIAAGIVHAGHTPK